MEQIARFKPGTNVPAFAASTVIAGRFVKISADKTSAGAYSITHCGAAGQPFGVSERDSAPSTDPATSVERMVNVVRRGAIARVLVGADVVAGDAIKSDANGKAVPQGGSGIIAGYACNTVTLASGGYVEVDLI